MKKSLAYATIALLLGTALMFLPLSLFTNELKYGAEPDRNEFPIQPLTNAFKESSLDSERRAGITPNHPLDIISAGLILTFSFIIALFIALRLKKKVIQP